MTRSSAPSSLVLGLALFSMFFGSGNLIFPLFLGYIGSDDWLSALAGFLTTAVGLPLLGVVAMVLYSGNHHRFFSQIGAPLGFLLSAILLIVWIPLGSGPRCISLSYASLQTYLDMPSLWIYAVVYSGLVAWIVLQKSRMLNILGSYLTPLLLLSLLAIVAFGYHTAPMPHHNAVSHQGIFFRGILEGYNTMDLIASFFFSASVIGLLQREQLPLPETLRLVFRAGAVAALILAVVYGSLLYTAATHSAFLVDIPREQMLAHLSKVFLGAHMGGIAAVAIFLACLTTSVALASVFAEFLNETICKGRFGYYYALLGSSLVSFAMALTGLEGITAVTSPALQICYPLLLLLIIYAVARYVWEQLFPVAEKGELSEET